jgi:hypothetical protein
MHPEYGTNFMKVREELHYFCGTHPTVCKSIFKNCTNASDDNFQQEFNQWRKSILDPTVWGGVAHMTLFAYRFKIHCVCVSVWNTRVTKTYTYGIERLKKFRMKSVSEDFNDQPRNPDEIIFIWHHNSKKPTN